MPSKATWDFWIDRGGTFTDVIAPPAGRDAGGAQAPVGQSGGLWRRGRAGHPRSARPQDGEPIPAGRIGAVKMGTTVATNALLERKGERTLLLITRDFATRSRSATRRGRKSSPGTSSSRRCSTSAWSKSTNACMPTAPSRAQLDLAAVRRELQAAHADGINAVAIVFMHAYRHPEHEQRVAALAREIGFPQVSVSHEVSPLIKLVGRGDTTVVDAYLSPILRRYVEQVAQEMVICSPSPRGGSRAQRAVRELRHRRPPARRPPPARGETRGRRTDTPPDVHDVVGRAHRGRAVPGQGRNPLRAGRRRGRHGGDRARGRLHRI